MPTGCACLKELKFLFFGASIMKKINFLFVVFGFLIINGLSVLDVAAQMQTDIPSPAGGGFFGRQVAALPNGNFVVTDPGYDGPGPITDVGRVYLYNGVTLALINTMTGTTAGDFVGSDFSGRGITVLANGDYIIASSSWNGGRGAATRCNAATGCPSTISSANSLVGSAADDNVGGDGVTALPNGNYVVRSSQWDNGATANVGAITWCSGSSGCTDAVSAANSRVGTTAGDQIGLIGIIMLSNGNYVTQDVFWDNGAATDAGAVTFCTATAVCTGAVSISNSLVGTTTNEAVGNNGIFPLTNGNYVVTDSGFDNGATMDVGAATFCGGTTGCAAAVGSANSLIGTTANDRVSLDGITALTNGNYVVRSSAWDNGGTADVGAATFCNGTTGCVATTVSTSNSLHGSTAGDGGFLRATALTNGNYVVANDRWDNVAMSEIDVGASTWCDGTTGCTGPVTPANSLIGGRAGESIGVNGTLALTNGNYIVLSPDWSGPNLLVSRLGAVTFCNGTSGCPGMEVSPANSLVGSTTNDEVGGGGGTAAPLTNGNYVVTSALWNNGATADVGAATFCSGTSGCIGPVTPANSLIGSAANNRVGSGGALALVGGNYVVISPFWDNGATSDVGALTTCYGSSGCVATVSTFNSLVGSTTNDFVGAFGERTALANGNYVVRSGNWDNDMLTDAGAVSYGFGVGGAVGAITVNNSVRGTTSFPAFGQNHSFDSTNNQLVVGRPDDNIVTVFRPGAPTAASVTVGGRVVTFNGRGIAKARVMMTDANGEMRTALTNSFGYYRFAEVEVGQTYIISVRSKQYLFNPQVLTILEELSDLDFIGFPNE